MELILKYNNRHKLYSFLLALVIYLSTVASFPNYISYIIIVFIGLLEFYKRSIKRQLNYTDLYLITFIIFSVIIFYYGKIIDKQLGNQGIDWERSVEYFPFTIFLLGTIFFCKKDNELVLYYLFYFILLESCLAIVQFIIGVPYLIKPSAIGETEFGQTDFLYYNRVYGLSPNVSLLAQKIMSAIVLVFYLKGVKYKQILIPFLLVALVISFGRTAILSIMIFLLFYFVFYLKTIKIKYKILITIVIIGLLVYINQNIDLILNQVFRGREDFDISGRDNIFPAYLDYVENNFLLGNLFEKIFISIGGKSYHAHNSYLQMLATMGVLPFVFFVIYLFKIIRKDILIFILPFLIFSVSQYGLFWGSSLLDIVFYTIIFSSYSNYVPKIKTKV